jgi:hypothetical protein
VFLHLVKVTRTDVDYLIEKGYLKNEKGRYKELHIASREKKGKRKNYYVPDYLARKIKK